MLLTPAQNSAGANAIFLSLARATVKGMNVPKSPREPESSERDMLLKCWMVRCLQKLSKLIGLYLLCDGAVVLLLSKDAASAMNWSLAFGALACEEGFDNPSSSLRSSFIILFCELFCSKGVDNKYSSECKLLLMQVDAVLQFGREYDEDDSTVKK